MTSHALLSSPALQAYKENRIKMLETLEKSGVNPWPHKFHVNISVNEFIGKYSHLEKAQQLEGEVVSLAGMICTTQKAQI